MKECQNFSTTIQNYIAGEIPPSELESLRQHCLSCPDCRALLDLHIEVSELGEDIPQPGEAEFEMMRDRVMAQIPRERRTPLPSARWWNLGGLFRLRPVLALPAAAVLLVVAVFVGRWSAAPSTQSVQNIDNILYQEVARQASQQQGLDGYWDTPFSYSNVSVKPVTGGNVDLSFDVCRHINMVTPANSLVAKEILFQAILASAPMGTRMKAMDLAPSVIDPKLEEALVFTMHNDPDLAVRLEAMSVLTRVPYNEGVQEALMTTLRNDKSVQMRLLALERLAEKQVRMETLKKVIDDSNMESNPALMQHAVKLTGGVIDEY